MLMKQNWKNCTFTDQSPHQLIWLSGEIDIDVQNIFFWLRYSPNLWFPSSRSFRMLSPRANFWMEPDLTLLFSTDVYKVWNAFLTQLSPQAFILSLLINQPIDWSTEVHCWSNVIFEDIANARLNLLYSEALLSTWGRHIFASRRLNLPRDMCSIHHFLAHR